MNALKTRTGVAGCRRLRHGLAALALAWGGGALAQDVVTVPAAHLQHAEGSIALAPQGEKEWHDVQPRRLLKRGDRLWTDRGSRAEVQAGGQALRLNGETQMVLENVSDTATQLSVTQGTITATVTHLNPGDSFEIGTPNLAFRARQPGDYRIDVDTKAGVTHIAVQSGSAVVYGEKGEALEVKNGQRVAFRSRDLSRVLQPAFAATDDFDRWTSARKRGEPTVSMPVVAQAKAPEAPSSPFVNRGRDIVISGPASSLPGPKAPHGQAVAKATPAAPAATIVAPVAKAQPLPTVTVTPNVPPAATLRVEAPATAVAMAVPSVSAKAEAEARARAQAEAAAQAARDQQERERQAQQRADEERKAAAARAESERRAAAAAEAKRAESERRAAAAAAEAKRAEAERRAEAKRGEDKRRSLAARRMEEERRATQARHEQEQKRLAAAAKRAEEERKIAQAKRAAEEKRLAIARKAEERRIAEERRLQLARLQEQARRTEQSAQVRRDRDRDQARRAEDERRDEQARRDDQVRREEQARREEELRRQRALADQVRREQQQRDDEVWLRQQQIYPQQPVRPAPMGVPVRRVS